MRWLADILIALLQVCEAEVTSVRRGIHRMFSSLLLQLAGYLVGVFGIVLMVLSVYSALSQALGVPIAALLSGVIALGIAGLLISLAAWRGR